MICLVVDQVNTYISLVLGTGGGQSPFWIYKRDFLDNEDLSVDMIAREVGLNRVHLHRRMKELTNQTPHAFIRNTRLQYAEKLLTHSNKTITDINTLYGGNIEMPEGMILSHSKDLLQKKNNKPMNNNKQQKNNKKQFYKKHN